MCPLISFDVLQRPLASPILEPLFPIPHHGARHTPALDGGLSAEEADPMKRQKRDMNSRAFDRGYQAGLAGRSADFCPHTEEDHRHHWLSGWREGRSDQWDGLTGVSGVHKLRAV